MNKDNKPRTKPRPSAARSNDRAIAPGRDPARYVQQLCRGLSIGALLWLVTMSTPSPAFLGQGFFGATSQSGSFSTWTPSQLLATFGSSSPSGIAVTDSGLGLEFTNTSGTWKASSNASHNATTYSFTVPDGVTRLELGAIGGGGGGAVGPCTNGAGAGGGAVYLNTYTVSAGATVTVQVAAGGRAGYTNARSSLGPPYGVTNSPYKGGTSSVMINGTALITATGGAGGKYDDACGSTTVYNSDGMSSAQAATGGSGSGGSANYTGGSGGWTGTHSGCGGGGAASPLGGNGANATCSCSSGASGISASGSSWSAKGGAGSCAAGVQSMNGSSFGAGGGSMETDGTTNTYAGYVGHGAPGMVRIIFR